MNYPCVKLFSGESISFPWNSSFKEARDADLEAFLYQCGTAVSLIEMELKQRQQQRQRKRPTGLEGYRERLRKCAARIKISQTLDKKQATENAKIAATVMTSNQTNRFDKIYQDILFDISRLCGPELVLLCAAALGKHKISHLNKDDQLLLLKFLQEKKLELNVNGLAALADLYEIPRFSPGSFGNLAQKRAWDEGPGADLSDSPTAPATPCQNAVNAHTEPSESCPATTSVAPKVSSFHNSSASSSLRTMPAPISPDAIEGSDWNLLFADHGDEITQRGLRNEWDGLNIDAPSLNVYATSNDENLWCELHTQAGFAQRQ